jgi:iron complex transport system substrate-binding protein
MQADIVKELVKNGIEVYCFNHRSVQGILEMIIKVGAITGYQDESIHLVAELTANIEKAETLSRRLKVRPKVYFEEWFKPLITGIRWVSESIEICGGDDIFPEHRKSHNAKGRILEDDSKIIIRNPDIILASWCGKPFRKQKLLRRDNWDSINAVKSDSVFEIDSAVILQPGPAVLSDGLEILSKIFIEWADRHGELIDNYN